MKQVLLFVSIILSINCYSQFKNPELLYTDYLSYTTSLNKIKNNYTYSFSDYTVIASGEETFYYENGVLNSYTYNTSVGITKIRSWIGKGFKKLYQTKHQESYADKYYQIRIVYYKDFNSIIITEVPCLM